ncbi:MAG: ankyrin repeat domain-containing protein [Pseudomonadota bacterium]|nr:ankyrin repeat domain-containing protein [Pseudomonadota bacterium]QKK05015.1 MAG: ankyrin repeat domain-containing protein [Pseudomonadota bacterium]
MINPFKKPAKTPEQLQAEASAAAALAASVPEGSLPVFKNADTLSLYFEHYPEEKQIAVSLPKGDRQTLTIPAPDKKDLRWAKSLIKKPPEERGYELCESCYKNRLWRVYFLLEQQKDTPPEKRALDGAHEIREYFAQSPLNIAAINGYHDLATLLVSHGADIDTKYTTRRDTPLMKAIYYDRLDIVKLLIGQEAKFYPDEFEKVSHPEIKEYLAQTVGHKLSPAVAQYGNLNKKQKAKAVNAVIGWNKAGDDSIVKSVNLGGGMRLHTVFNFKAEHVLRYTESVDLKGQTIAVSAPSAAEDFQRIRNRAEIDEAFRVFLAQNGDESLRPASNSAAPRRIQKKNP